MTDSAWKARPQPSYRQIAEQQDNERPTEAHLPVRNRVRRSFALKRAFDIVMALIALILLSPVLLTLALMLTSRYRNVPVFFGGRVVGVHGKPFRMWKFSTMKADAHIILKDMLDKNPALRAEWSANVKLNHDPRILPGLGDFLRRTSLNEMPQFYNVLVGDMSLVGPRPITKIEEDLYIRLGGPEMLERRHAQRPGITGLWQATGRSDVSYAERVQIDDSYLRNQSFLMDLKILWWTVGKVISRRGAV